MKKRKPREWWIHTFVDYPVGPDGAREVTRVLWSKTSAKRNGVDLAGMIHVREVLKKGKRK